MGFRVQDLLQLLGLSIPNNNYVNQILKTHLPLLIVNWFFCYPEQQDVLNN